LEGWRDGVLLSFGPPARRAVLGVLAANSGVLVRRDTIIDMLWGHAPPDTADDLVRAHVSKLRTLLTPTGRDASARDSRIASIGGAYQLRLAHQELDLLVFRELAAQADAAQADNDGPTACGFYEQAVRLWRGDPMADVDIFCGHPAVAELRRQLADVLLQYAKVASSLGLHDRVLPRLRALAAEDQLNERVHAHLMIALAGCGQQATALSVYEDLRRRLDRELGAYPSEELIDAHLRVLRQDIPSASPKARHPGTLARFSHMVPRQLPAASRYFTGRAAELEALTCLLEPAGPQPGGVVIAALTGMAGIGKTALAVHWAHQVADRFPDGQLFVNLRGFYPSDRPLAPAEAVRGFLTALGMPAAEMPGDTAGRAALYRSLLAGRRILILLDNALDAEQVRPLLPGSPGCVVLVTSRNRLIGLAAADGADLIALGTLTEAEARSLLTASLSNARTEAEPMTVSELIALCAHLPLALCDAAARAAARPALPLAALTAEMRDERGRLDALETGEPTTSVRMVFSWSRAKLGQPTARMFRLLGVHPGADITVPAAASLAGLPRSEAYLALAELCDEHLLIEHAPGRYTCHALLHAFAAEGARAHETDAELRTAVHRLVDHYLHTAIAASNLLYPYHPVLAPHGPLPGVLPEEIDNPRQAAEWFENERRVLLTAVSHAAEEGYVPHAWELAWAVGMFFSETTSCRRLAAAQESALAVAERLGHPVGQALARHHLGMLRFRLSGDAMPMITWMQRSRSGNAVTGDSLPW
jgi:DNA-binding SARP family transcriptional activator